MAQKAANKGGRPKGESPVKGLRIEIKVPESGRLSSRQEMMVANSIILFKGDISKASKFLKIDPGITSEVYLKYNQNINQALAKAIDDDKANKAINDSLEIMQKHIKGIKKLQGKGTLYASSLDSCLSTVDRLVKIKDASSNSFFRCVSGLGDSIVKSKMAEKVEEGMDFGGSDYRENQATVASLIEGKMQTASAGLMETMGAFVVKAVNDSTGASKQWPDMGSFCSEVGATEDDISAARQEAVTGKKDSFSVKGWTIIQPEIKKESGDGA